MLGEASGWIDFAWKDAQLFWSFLLELLYSLQNPVLGNFFSATAQQLVLKEWSRDSWSSVQIEPWFWASVLFHMLLFIKSFHCLLLGNLFHVSLLLFLHTDQAWIFSCWSRCLNGLRGEILCHIGRTLSNRFVLNLSLVILSSVDPNEGIVNSGLTGGKGKCKSYVP